MKELSKEATSEGCNSGRRRQHTHKVAGSAEGTHLVLLRLLAPVLLLYELGVVEGQLLLHQHRTTH